MRSLYVEFLWKVAWELAWEVDMKELIWGS